MPTTWINLKHYVPPPKPEAPLPPDDLDARLKSAAVIMRRRWDAHNAAHGIEVDYDTLSVDYAYETEGESGDSDGDLDEHGDPDNFYFDDTYDYQKRMKR